MYKYQNISKTTQTITHSGNVTPREVKAGEAVVSEVPLENPNFKYVGSEDQAENADQTTQTNTQNEENK
jgi:hypothetical protein